MTTIDDVIFNENTKQMAIRGNETMENSYKQEKPFLNKTFTYIEDNNGNSDYGTNQCKFSLKNMAANGRWNDLKNSVLAIPKIAIFKRTGRTQTIDKTLRFNDASKYLTYKSGSWNDIHSFKLDYGNNNIIQQRENINAYINYKHMNQNSGNDVDLNSGLDGFYKNSNEWTFKAEEGLCNTNNTLGYEFSFNNYDATKSPIITQDNFNNSGANYYKYETVGVVNADLALDSFKGEHVFYTTSYIRLKDLPFLENMIMTQGADIEITIWFNQSETIVTYVAGAKTAFVNNLRGSSNILHRINETVVNNDYSDTMSWKVGSHKSYIDNTKLYEHQLKRCRLYIPSYILHPLFDEKYLSIGTKKIVFDDIIVHSIMDIKTGSFNYTITDSVANVKRLVIVPMLNKVSNGIQAVSSQESLFCSSPCTCVPCTIDNFNVKVASIPLYPECSNYKFETFLNEMDGQEGVYANKVSGMSSGLINKVDYESGVYGYITVDLSRKSELDYDKGFSLSIQGLLKSPATLDFLCYVVVKRECMINLADGSIREIR